MEGGYQNSSTSALEGSSSTDCTSSDAKVPHHPDQELPFPEYVHTVLSEELEEKVQIVIATVTAVEFKAVYRKMMPLSNKEKIIRVRPGDDFYMIGRFGVYCVALVQSEMGSAAAQTVVSEALKFLKPKATIMIGVAFGLKPEKQTLGDVMISSRLATYDPQRIGADISIERGVIVSSGKNVSKLFSDAAIFNWEFENVAVHRGLMISGSKLVDNSSYATELVHRFPEAIGGEMEGAGVYEACNKENQQWVIVKAICDFAGLKGEKTKEAQPFAAATATSVAHHVLSTHNLQGLGCTIDAIQDPPVTSILSIVRELGSTDSGSSSGLYKSLVKVCTEAWFTEFARFLQRENVSLEIRYGLTIVCWSIINARFQTAQPDIFTRLWGEIANTMGLSTSCEKEIRMAQPEEMALVVSVHKKLAAGSLVAAGFLLDLDSTCGEEYDCLKQAIIHTMIVNLNTPDFFCEAAWKRLYQATSDLADLQKKDPESLMTPSFVSPGADRAEKVMIQSLDMMVIYLCSIPTQGKHGQALEGLKVNNKFETLLQFVSVLGDENLIHLCESLNTRNGSPINVYGTLCQYLGNSCSSMIQLCREVFSRFIEHA